MLCVRITNFTLSFFLNEATFWAMDIIFLNLSFDLNDFLFPMRVLESCNNSSHFVKHDRIALA